MFSWLSYGFIYEVLLDSKYVKFEPHYTMSDAGDNSKLKCILFLDIKEKIDKWCKDNNISYKFRTDYTDVQKLVFGARVFPYDALSTSSFKLSVDEKRAYEECRPRLLFRSKSDAILFKLSF